MHLVSMIQMQFTRPGRGNAARGALPEDANATDMAIAQVLGLANSAGFRFDLIEGRLVTISHAPDWRMWPTLRACLDDIGAEAVIAYFERTSPERQKALSAPAQ